MRRRGEVGRRDAVEAGGAFLGAGVSYRIVECSRLRKSKARRLPSAPTETNMSVEPGSQATSYTSRSCAMSCVMAVAVSMFQTVHVVSMDEVTMRLGDFSFHEKLVKGAPEAWFCTFDCPERPVLSVSRCPLPLGCLPTYADDARGASPAYSHTLNASDVVASSSVLGDLPVQGNPVAVAGCHCRFVAG